MVVAGRNEAASASTTELMATPIHLLFHFWGCWGRAEGGAPAAAAAAAAYEELGLPVHSLACGPSYVGSHV